MKKETDIVKNTYDKIALEYHKRFGKYSPLFLKNAEEFVSFLPKNAKILDLGCGAGRDAEYFTNRGFEVVGIDFSKRMLEVAKGVAPKAQFIQKDFRNFNFERDSFDGIWMSFALLHLKRSEVPEFLSRIKKFLKPEGILFIATKEGKGEQVEKEHLDNQLLMFESFWQKNELEDLIQKSGYKISSSKLDTDRYESSEKIIILFARK